MFPTTVPALLQDGYLPFSMENLFSWNTVLLRKNDVTEKLALSLDSHTWDYVA